MFWRTKYVVVSGVVFAAVLAILGMVVMAFAMQRLNDSAGLVARSNAVLLRIGSVLSMLQDAETGQRGFLITGAPEYLKPYESAVTSLSSELRALGDLVADKPRQKRRVDAVERGAAAKLAELAETIELRKAQGFEPASTIVLSGRGKAEMDRLREALGEMKLEEMRSRDTREFEAQNAYRRGLQMGLAAAVLALTAVLLLAALWFRYRRAMEGKLHQSESQLRITLACIGDAVISTDAASNVIYLNQAATQLTGWAYEDAVGRQLAEVFRVHDEPTKDEIEDPAARATQSGQIASAADYPLLISKQGRRVPIEDSIAPIQSEAGVVSGNVLIFRDVTDKRERIKGLESSERLFRSLADSIPQLCWMADPDGHVFWYNRGWYEYTGKTLEETEGWGWQSVHDTDLLPGIMERWERSISEVVPFDMVLPLRGTDGPFRQFLTRALPVMDETGNVTRWFGTNTDVTVAKEAEEALTRREQELRSLADNSPDILARFDRGLRHVFVNAAAEKYTGIGASEFLGKTNRELRMPVELCDTLDAAINTVFLTGRAVSREFSFESAQGLRHFKASLNPEKAASGAVDHVLAVAHDRTAEKDAQDALRVADRRKDEFLATLAHELRNPLATLRTGLDVLRLAKGPEIALRTQLMMERQLGQTVRLIDDLMEVSRITTGKVVLRLARIELRGVIDAAVEAVRPQLDARAHVLALDLFPEPIWLQADAARICQIVTNLLDNALKYSPAGSKVGLSTHREGSEVLITVSDSGAGIHQDMLTRVFDMFAQVERTLDRAQGGLGIGLALVKRLTERHGGTVIAESSGLGTGSIFRVRLPILVKSEAADSNVAPQCVDVSEKRLRVLVVDDNHDAAESLAALISILGHETRVAESGASALALIWEFQPSLVFLDIGMQGMDGYETARRMRMDSSSAPVTLVALTGWGTEADKIKSKAAGFDYHFTKPVEIRKVEHLLSVVAAGEIDIDASRLRQ
jgi:PAS domain S-box-containing protein